MEWVTDQQIEVAIRLAVAAAAGLAVGIERERREQVAGLRTHMLVALGACLFTLVSIFGFDGLVGDEPSARMADLTRVASTVVTGVGFLGAGAIIREGVSVRGLTTAASLWVVAALGVAAGVGMYFAVGVAAVVTVVALWALRPVRERLRQAGERGPDDDDPGPE